MPPLDRADFPVCERLVYLDHAGVNALPGPVAAAMAAWARRAAAGGSTTVDDDEAELETVRARAAALMGVRAEEVAFVKNTTEGLAFVAGGLDWRPGDRVVVPAGEFPSTWYPWLALAERGVVVDTVAPAGPGGVLPVDAFAAVVEAGAPPRLVVSSWVQFGRGFRVDLPALAELAHGVGALLCVDAIQGLGVLPADLAAWGVDFAAADAHKWLLGPSGIGVLAAVGGALDRLRPLEPGWASVAHRHQWDNPHLVWDPTARRLEGGSANFAGTTGLGAALGLLDAAGVEAIWSYVDGLCDHMVAGLERAGCPVLSDRGEGRSAIVTFEVPGTTAEAAVAALAARGVVTSARGGGVRAAPHGYNLVDDVDALVDAVTDLRPHR